ncbi:hypothetical protein HLK59_11250 [Streptomyces sp. S3(2020)]|uniref:hypothetical protein n=1 Tax=Streptomyces sp. S3(2020) TaxID=2732044 RepID=UPI001488C314|nr:hypothetical protein [Streptomyces sp. S3(2020)]NNN30936.1 hypothetical protein [Streptomyces sp. S3(2020)]
MSVLDTDPLDRHVTGPAALLVTTHRGGTVPAVEAAVAALGERLDGVRRANTGGPWPPATTTFTRSGLSLTLSGNRGVTNPQLLAAAETLRTDTTADPLLTHVLPLEPGVRHLDQIIGDRTRVIDGELVMRLVIDLGNVPAHRGDRLP